MNEYIFKSNRLGFREWNKEDLIPFSSMNSDPEVMEFFPRTLTKNETEKFIEKIKEHFNKNEYGLYAVDKLESNVFIGFIGFMIPSFKAHFTPCIEIGWRIKKEEWNRGYATEGAKRCIKFGFEKLNFNNIYSFSSKLNLKSERVMVKIGMKKEGEFDHPKVDKGNKLRPHVVYRIVKTVHNNYQM
ncbi:MAG: GNAT family N-acetyltransferase [Bacteroidetes bacterium]|nr:GNAT family N-acetyltransferase [Bacteroidota bacterium]